MVDIQLATKNKPKNLRVFCPYLGGVLKRNKDYKLILSQQGWIIALPKILPKKKLLKVTYNWD